MASEVLLQIISFAAIVCTIVFFLTGLLVASCAQSSWGWGFQVGLVHTQVLLERGASKLRLRPAHRLGGRLCTGLAVRVTHVLRPPPCGRPTQPRGPPLPPFAAHQQSAPVPGFCNPLSAGLSRDVLPSAELQRA